MKSIGKRALLILVSSLFGSALWLANSTPVIVGTARLEDLGVIDRALVDGGGFIFGGTLGIAGAVYMLRRFWRMIIPK